MNGAAFRTLYYRIMAEASGVLPQADLMYLVSQTRSNESSVLNRVSDFSGPVGIIGYPNTEKLMGYPGSDVWIPELHKRGVPDDRIVPVQGSFIEVGGKQTIHTLSEMQAMVRYARTNAIRKIVLVAPRFHLLRAFMSAILGLVEYYPELRLYPALGTPQAWEEESSHSQGALKGVRVDFFVEEMIRIYTYHAVGSLPDPEVVLDYLDRRDALRKQR